MSQPIGIVRYTDPDGVVLGFEAEQLVRIDQIKVASGKVFRLIKLKNGEERHAKESFEMLEARHMLQVSMARGDKETARICLQLCNDLMYGNPPKPEDPVAEYNEFLEDVEASKP